MKIVFGLVFMTVAISCSRGSGNYVFTSDRNERPITGCIKLSAESYMALAMAMNCQNSVFENIKLCSHGRIVEYYSSKTECDEIRTSREKQNGTYTLRSDNDAQ